MSKGDRRRKTLIPQAQADANFESIFGKYVPTYLRKQLPNDDDKPVDHNPTEDKDTE